jgi:hypothetical protein
MLTVKIRRFPRTTVSWFAERAALPSFLERCITYEISFVQTQERPTSEVERSATVSAFTTLVVDLDSDEETLWNEVRGRTRSYIRSAEANVPHRIAWHRHDPDDRFYDFLSTFCAKQGLWIPSRSLYRAYLRHGVVSECSTERGIVAAHYYVVDPNSRRVRLLWSARTLDEAATVVAAKLNKLLHWKDILYFRNEFEMHTYDWGGIALDDPALKGIDSFKRGFGGTIVTEWNVNWRSRLNPAFIHDFRQEFFRRTWLQRST